MSYMWSTIISNSKKRPETIILMCGGILGEQVSSLSQSYSSGIRRRNTSHQYCLCCDVMSKSFSGSWFKVSFECILLHSSDVCNVLILQTFYISHVFAEPGSLMTLFCIFFRAKLGWADCHGNNMESEFTITTETQQHIIQLYTQ